MSNDPLLQPFQLKHLTLRNRAHAVLTTLTRKASLDLRSLAAWTATPQGWRFLAWQSCGVKF